MTVAPVLPMWGLWLDDPSGKYGAHKPFYEHGETAADAEASALARYKVAGTSIDPSRAPFLLGHCDARAVVETKAAFWAKFSGKSAA